MTDQIQTVQPVSAQSDSEAGKWIPKDLDPALIKALDASKNLLFKHLTPDLPEVAYLRSLDKKQMQEWEEQADRAIDFFLSVRDCTSFAKGVHAFCLFGKYRDAVLTESDRLRQMGQPMLRIPYKLRVVRVTNGVSAGWYTVKFDRIGAKGKFARRDEYIRQTVRATYGRNVFMRASKSIRDYIFTEIESILGPLRQQTEKMEVIRRHLKTYRALGKEFYEDPKP